MLVRRKQHAINLAVVSATATAAMTATAVVIQHSNRNSHRSKIISQLVEQIPLYREPIIFSSFEFELAIWTDSSCLEYLR